MCAIGLFSEHMACWVYADATVSPQCKKFLTMWFNAYWGWSGCEHLSIYSGVPSLNCLLWLSVSLFSPHSLCLPHLCPYYLSSDLHCVSSSESVTLDGRLDRSRGSQLWILHTRIEFTELFCAPRWDSLLIFTPCV
jgi:hypothetical protein